MVDAKDLKSFELCSCRFESGSRHHTSLIHAFPAYAKATADAAGLASFVWLGQYLKLVAREQSEKNYLTKLTLVIKSS